MIFVFHFLVLFSVLEFLQFLLRQALEWKKFISLFRFRNYHCFCTRSPSVNCSYLKEYFRVCLDVLQFLAFQKIIFWVAFTDFHFQNWVKKHSFICYVSGTIIVSVLEVLLWIAALLRYIFGYVLVFFISLYFKKLFCQSPWRIFVAEMVSSVKVFRKTSAKVLAFLSISKIVVLLSY